MATAREPVSGGRILDSAGQPLGDDFIVNSTTNGSQSEPTVVALPDGRFVVSWGTQEASGDVRARVFEVDGQPVDDDFIVATTTPNFQGYPSMVALADGGLFITWSSEDGGDGSGTCIRGRFLNADGSAAGDDFIVNTTTADHQFRPDVTVLTDGRLVVTWQSLDGGDGDGDGVRARILGADGSPVGDDFIVNTTGSGDQGSFGPAITALAGGGFVAAWVSEEDSDGSAACVRGRVFDADGIPTGDDFILNTTTFGPQETPAIVALADGRFVAVWESSDNGPGDGDLDCIRGRLFNADGSPAGDDFLVNSTVEHAQLGPEVAALADGRFVVSWTSHDSTGDGSGSSPRARIFDPTVFNGTAAVDLWQGGSLTDHITGADGADTLSGLGGDDTITGGVGDDALDGGAGADQLFGGGGADMLDGGDGDDKVFGGSGDDIVGGGQGADAMDGGGDNDMVTYANSDAAVQVDFTTGIHAGGHAAGDTLTSVEIVTGSAFGDTLTGGAGAETFNGGAGDDLLSGDGGNDFLNGSNGDDALSGGDDDDGLLGGAGADALDGGGGADTASYANSDAAVQVSLASGVNTGGHAAGDTHVSVENLHGSLYGDTLAGDGSANTLNGWQGDDFLFGDGGDDFLNGSDGDDALLGGAGADAFDGGDGVDTAYYSNSAAAVAVDLAAGTGSGGDAAGDTFTDVENLYGSALDDILGGMNGVDNTLNGFQGSDTLVGYSGDDVLLGGLGDDFLDGGEGDDVLSGYLGVDTFIYNVADFGRDVIIGFEDGVDLFDLNGGLTFTDFTVAAAGPGTRLMLTDTSHSILILGVPPGQIDAGDFV